jgi:hypothetical protein
MRCAWGLPGGAGDVERGPQLVDLSLHVVADGVGSLADTEELAPMIIEPLSPGIHPRWHFVAAPRAGLEPRHRVLEPATLGDGGLIGTVVSEDACEDIAGLIDVGVWRDDVELVRLSTPGHRDVQAAVRAGRSDEGDADIHGVALVAVLGGGVAEADVLRRVLG